MSGMAKMAGLAFAAVVAPVALPALATAATGAAATFTAGAAAGGGSILTSTLLNAGKSALIGGLVSKATGGDFKDGAIAGGLAGGATSLMGGFGAATGGGTVAGGVNPVTPATAATAGSAAAPAAVAAPGGFASTGFGKFLFGGDNPIAGQMIKGAAQGYMQKAQMEDERGFIRERDQRLTDSYEGAGEALRYDRPSRFETSANRRPVYQYNRESRRIERV